MASEQVIVLTDQMMAREELEKRALLLADFWAPWCGPCRMMGPVVERLAEEYAGRLSVGKLNVDDYGELAAQYRVASIPTLILFQNGREVERLIGATNQAKLKQVIDGYLPKEG